MTWLKRNLFWVIGGVVALGLLGAAFFYLYTNMQSEKEIDEQLNQKLARWDELSKAGSANREPIEAVKEDEKKVQTYLTEARKFFSPLAYPSINDSREFRFFLDTTLNNLERSAESSAVSLPPKPYTFSFKPQSESVQFETANLKPLTMQLSEVAEISGILFKAKIHSLESVRRVPVAKEDIGASEYLDRKAVTNRIGELLEIHVPYEFTFRSFSAELGEAVEGLARSPNCFLIKSLNTETTTPVASGAQQPGGILMPQPGLPFHDPYRSRYGLVPGASPGGAGSGGMMDWRMRMRYGAPPPPEPAPTTAPPPKAGPVTILDEKPLRITMTVEVVRLVEASAAAPGRAKASK